MKMFIQNDKGVVYEVRPRACGCKACSLHCKRCEDAKAGKEPCQKMIGFISSMYYAPYGFVRVKGIVK